MTLNICRIRSKMFWLLLSVYKLVNCEIRIFKIKNAHKDEYMGRKDDKVAWVPKQNADIFTLENDRVFQRPKIRVVNSPNLYFSNVENSQGKYLKYQPISDENIFSFYIFPVENGHFEITMGTNRKLKIYWSAKSNQFKLIPSEENTLFELVHVKDAEFDSEGNLMTVEIQNDELDGLHKTLEICKKDLVKCEEEHKLQDD